MSDRPRIALPTVLVLYGACPLIGINFFNFHHPRYIGHSAYDIASTAVTRQIIPAG